MRPKGACWRRRQRRFFPQQGGLSRCWSQNESAADRGGPSGGFRMLLAGILGLAATTMVYGQWRDGQLRMDVTQLRDAVAQAREDQRRLRARVAGERLREGEEKKRLEGPDRRRARSGGTARPSARRDASRGREVGARRPRGYGQAYRRPGDRARGGRANHPRFCGRGSAHRGSLRLLRRGGMSPPRVPGRRRPAPPPGRRLAGALPRGERASVFAGVLRHRLSGGQTRPPPHQPPRGRALVERRDRPASPRRGDEAPLRGLPSLLPRRARAFRALDRARVQDRGPGRGRARPA